MDRQIQYLTKLYNNNIHKGLKNDGKKTRGCVTDNLENELIFKREIGS
jgi:hypothetical protein